MKHLVIVGNVESTEYDSLCTSSSKYEFAFAQALSEYVDKVSVVSPKLSLEYHRNNISFYPCMSGDLMYNIEPVTKKIKYVISNDEDTVILFWGYNPFVIKSFCGLKSSGIKLVTMIYDTHLGVLTKKKFHKKLMINMFYTFGMKQVNKLDGIFLFKESSKEYLKIKTKSQVILPMTDIEKMIPYGGQIKDTITFLYCGTLCDYNGIKELLEAFEELEDRKVFLKLYGDGPMKSFVQEKAKLDQRIVYGGQVSGKEIEQEIEKADILLNLRKVPSVVNDFAFPSKIMEYMSSGKAVISTNVSEHDEFKDAVFLLENMEKETILSVMRHVSIHREEIEDKVNKSHIYLKKHHNKKNITKKAYEFMFETLFFD